jgi:hypothetical protein
MHNTVVHNLIVRVRRRLIVALPEKGLGFVFLADILATSCSLSGALRGFRVHWPGASANTRHGFPRASPGGSSLPLGQRNSGLVDVGLVALFLLRSCTTTFHRTSQRLLLLLSYMDGVRPNPHDNVERPPHSLLDPLDMRWRYCVGGRGTR